jgi:Fe-S-cluster containining protein
MGKCFCGSGKKQIKCHKDVNPESFVAKLIKLYSALDCYSGPPCSSNCYKCCYDYFYITELEFQSILWYVNAKLGKGYLASVIEKAKMQRYCLQRSYPSEFNKIDKPFCGAFPLTHENEMLFSDLVDGRTLTLSVPCPFLNSSGKCDIYSMRPLICRIYGSIRCSSTYRGYDRCKSNLTEDYPILREDDYKQLTGIGLLGNQYRRPYPLLEWFGDLVCYPRVQVRSADAYLLCQEEFLKKYT